MMSSDTAEQQFALVPSGFFEHSAAMPIEDAVNKVKTRWPDLPWDRLFEKLAGPPLYAVNVSVLSELLQTEVEDMCSATAIPTVMATRVAQLLGVDFKPRLGSVPASAHALPHPESQAATAHKPALPKFPEAKFKEEVS